MTSEEQEQRCPDLFFILAIWGEAYDRERNYLIQNVVFCPNCGKVSHFNDWDSDNRKK